MDTNGHTTLCEDYVSFEVAQLLKEKGFRENCIATYSLSSKQLSIEEVYQDWTSLWSSEISAPTLQMAMKWLREYKKLVISIDLNYSDNSYSYSIDSIIEHRIVGNGLGETYEEAIEAAIKCTLENLI